MPSTDRLSLDYSRQSLRKASKFVEGDYTGINPRQFYRSLKRSLEEIQEGNDFKYVSHGEQDENLSIESEAVGESTGTVKGRLAAVSDERDVGSGTFNYKPYGPQAALAIVVGLATSLFIIGIPIFVAGVYFYFKEERAEIPVSRQDVIRVLITGEVSERTIEEEDETRTDIFANMSVIYAGDSFVKVNTEHFSDLDWVHRDAIVREVTQWYNQVVDDETLQREVDTGFVGYLKSWANRDMQEDILTVGELQNKLNNKFESRIEYTDLLLKQLPPGVETEMEKHEDQVLAELKELAEDMDVYVEREGMQTT